MRLITYSLLDGDAGPRAGALVSDGIVDLADVSTATRQAEPLPTTLIEVLQLEDAGIEAARDVVTRAQRTGQIIPLEATRLHAPLPRPNSLRDFMTIEQHIIGCGHTPQEEWYNIPVYWKGNVEGVFGPGDEIRWPHYSDLLDFEVELGAVIGRRGTRIPRSEAQHYIVGYTIFNDWSARDIQRREMTVRLGPGLGKDFATSLGPCIVVPDEADDFDPYSAPVRVRVNGEVWAEGDMSDMRWRFDELVSHLSEEQVVAPGDVLGSGTMGNGCGVELGRELSPGDIVEIEMDGLGKLINRVAPAVPLPSDDFGAMRNPGITRA